MDIYQPYIEKVACMPQSKEDVLTMLLSCYEHKTISEKCAISMSDMGMISRIIGEMFGSEYTSAALPHPVRLVNYLWKRWLNI